MSAKEKAEFVVNRAIAYIKEEFPPLIYAINLLKLKTVDGQVHISPSTDKEYLYYSPEHIMCTFKHAISHTELL